MSRFIFKVYIENQHKGDFTSINQICDVMYEFLQPYEAKTRLIDAFNVPPFTRRKPQIHIDESIQLKVISQYSEFSGKL